MSEKTLAEKFSGWIEDIYAAEMSQQELSEQVVDNSHEIGLALEFAALNKGNEWWIKKIDERDKRIAELEEDGVTLRECVRVLERQLANEKIVSANCAELLLKEAKNK